MPDVRIQPNKIIDLAVIIQCCEVNVADKYQLTEDNNPKDSNWTWHNLNHRNLTVDNLPTFTINENGPTCQSYPFVKYTEVDLSTYISPKQ